ncbi:hypothetical protein ACP4OV_005170 [Aristida adscensionis]
MPLSRHKVGNEYALGGRELCRAADQHDPEAVLDGVAMAGLVGVLRQLGDLAEFAAQVFHGLYDDVMTTSARGHGLMLRVQQLEAELPLLEKDNCERDYLYVASNRGVDWHANPRVDHGVVARGDTPRFIMESIKQCRGPPKLFMLDKYDIGGEGACLKRYTDPSFFKTDNASSRVLQEGIQRERRPLRAMEIRPNLQNSEIFLPPNAADNDPKPGTDVSGEALDEVPTGRIRPKYRQLKGAVFQSFRPHMQNLYGKPSSEEKLLTVDPSEVHISLTDSPDSNNEERDIVVDTSINMHKAKEDRLISEEAVSRSTDVRSAGSSKGYNSEVDIYVDALTTMDSEVETDSEHRDRGHRAFAQVDSDKTCSDARDAEASRSGSFQKKDSSNVAEGDMSNQNEVIVPTPWAKPVAGEHERTSSLEELFDQEKPASCDHERTSSLEEFLTEDVHASEYGIRERVSESSCNGIVSNVVSNDTQDVNKKAKENSNIATISFKKIASKRSKYVGGMEMIASKVGILPRKLSKKHDPFSDSLRNMAKQLLELKYDGTQDSDTYDFEANGDECDIKCLDMYNPPTKFKESVMHTVPKHSHHDDIGSRECQQEEVNHESEHDVPPTDSPQDSVPDDANSFRDTNIVYLADIGSLGLREEGGAGAAPDEHTSTDVLNHIVEHAKEKIEEHSDREVTGDAHSEVVSENGSDTGDDLKEVSVCNDQLIVEDAEESTESDAHASDGEDDYIEEQVVSDGVISSPVSSKQSDDPCRITPLSLTDADPTVASKGTGKYTAEMELTISETFVETDLPEMVTVAAINSDTALSDNEQCYLHPKTSSGQDAALDNYEVVGQQDKLSPDSSSIIAAVPHIDVNTEEIHELRGLVQQEQPNSCSSSTEVSVDSLPPQCRDVPLQTITSFDWMLNGTVQHSLSVLPAQPAHGNVRENGSSENSEDAPPLPPLPPMQWRTNKLQMDSPALSAKSGRPPRPKPPAKYQESEGNSLVDGRNEVAEMLPESRLHKVVTLKNEMVQATVCNEHETDQFLNGDSQESHRQEEDKEYDVQDSNPDSPESSPHNVVTLKNELVQAAVPNEHEPNQFLNSDSQGNNCEGCIEYDVQDSNPNSLTRDKGAGASVNDENLQNLQIPELIVIPEEAWSEFGDMKLITGQEGKHQLSHGVSDHNGFNIGGLSTKMENQNHHILDRKEKEFSAAGSNKTAGSEASKPNGIRKQDAMPNPDLPARQGNGELCASDEKAMEISSTLKEELAQSETNSVPKPPRYPQLQVTSHDRSMLRKAPTLVQPSSKLSDSNNILEQIKNKSFNLKPVLAKRPNVMGGPRTNLQVVAILERAHAIRQAVADDDDEDSWSE